MLRIFLSLIIILSSVSVAKAFEINPRVNYSLPFIEKEWQRIEVNRPNVCYLSSGHNALDVIKQGDKYTVISTRSMMMGDYVRVSIGRHNFRSHKESFSAKKSAEIVKLITEHPKIYLEWSDTGGAGGNRLRTTNIVTNDGFKELLSTCN